MKALFPIEPSNPGEFYTNSHQKWSKLEAYLRHGSEEEITRLTLKYFEEDNEGLTPLYE